MTSIDRIKKCMSGGPGKLWAFGDSFTFGSELQDCTDEFQYSNNTWQGLTARHKGQEFSCVARGGVSNDWIVRQVLEKVDQISQDDTVAVQWTYLARFEFPIKNYQAMGACMKGKTHEVDAPDWLPFEHDNYFQTSPHITTQGVGRDKGWSRSKNKMLQDSGADKFNEMLYEKSDSDEHGAYQLLKNMALLQHVLEDKDYWFSFVSNEIMNYANHQKPMIRNLMDRISADRCIWFGTPNEGLGLDDWCTRQKFKRGKYNHPLEDAHNAAFKYIKETYNV